MPLQIPLDKQRIGPAEELVVTAHDPLRMKRERLQEQAVPDIGRRDFFDLRRVSNRGDAGAHLELVSERARRRSCLATAACSERSAWSSSRRTAEHGHDRISGELLDRTTR
jgi:hypothetical protein